MIDYASAGKSWRRDSQMEVWMEREEEERSVFYSHKERGICIN